LGAVRIAAVETPQAEGYGDGTMQQSDESREKQGSDVNKPKQISVRDSGIGCMLLLIFIALVVCATNLSDISNSIDKLTDAIQSMPR
jgi:hypothetical protein